MPPAQLLAALPCAHPSLLPPVALSGRGDVGLLPSAPRSMRFSPRPRRGAEPRAAVRFPPVGTVQLTAGLSRVPRVLTHESQLNLWESPSFSHLLPFLAPAATGGKRSFVVNRRGGIHPAFGFALRQLFLPVPQFSVRPTLLSTLPSLSQSRARARAPKVRVLSSRQW